MKEGRYQYNGLGGASDVTVYDERTFSQDCVSNALLHMKQGTNTIEKAPTLTPINPSLPSLDLDLPPRPRPRPCPYLGPRPRPRPTCVCVCPCDIPSSGLSGLSGLQQPAPSSAHNTLRSLSSSAVDMEGASPCFLNMYVYMFIRG